MVRPKKVGSQLWMIKCRSKRGGQDTRWEGIADASEGKSGGPAHQCPVTEQRQPQAGLCIVVLVNIGGTDSWKRRPATFSSKIWSTDVVSPKDYPPPLPTSQLVHGENLPAGNGHGVSQDNATTSRGEGVYQGRVGGFEPRANQPMHMRRARAPS